MKLLIDIDDEIYEKIQNNEFWLSCGLNLSNAYDFIKNGTPIPDNAGNDDAISREMALKECHDIVVEGERYRVIQEETLLGLPPVTQKLDKQAYNKGFEDCKQAVLDMATTIQTDDFSGNEVIEVVDADDIKALPPVTQKSIEDMPCITPEEMQKCKEVVKKYAPSVTQKPIECNDCIFKGV